MGVIADKKGEDVLLLDIRGLSVLTDFFIFCSGTSVRHLKTLAEEVGLQAKRQLRTMPRHVEGQPTDGWILMDYGGVVVHLFAPEVRAYYDLEGLWREGKVLLRVQ